MSVHYAVLGLLGQAPMTGYDLKKIMQDSTYMYWSGNNNQIYKALLQLSAEGLLTGEVIHQDGAPSKKVYHITEKGKAALCGWVLSTQPEAPEFKKPFLVQFAMAGGLEPQEILALLLRYQEEISMRFAMQKERARRSPPQRDGMAALLLRLTEENAVAFYQAELTWVQHAIKEIEAEKIKAKK